MTANPSLDYPVSARLTVWVGRCGVGTSPVGVVEARNRRPRGGGMLRRRRLDRGPRSAAAEHLVELVLLLRPDPGLDGLVVLHAVDKHVEAVE
jgi:hypothetical protein